jgi:hypothetical protein
LWLKVAPDKSSQKPDDRRAQQDSSSFVVAKGHQAEKRGSGYNKTNRAAPQCLGCILQFTIVVSVDEFSQSLNLQVVQQAVLQRRHPKQRRRGHFLPEAEHLVCLSLVISGVRGLRCGQSALDPPQCHMVPCSGEIMDGFGKIGDVDVGNEPGRTNHP